MKNLQRIGWLVALIGACFCNVMAQDTTSFRMASFSDSGELILFNDDSTTMYVGMMNSNASFNAIFHDPASGDLYCLHDTLTGNGDRHFYKFDPFLQTVTFEYAPTALFLAAACAGPNGKVYAVTGNSQVSGMIYEIDLANHTTTLFTTTDFTFGGADPTGLNITYYPADNELWLFGGGPDSLIKINVSTLAETRIGCSLNSDGAIKGTYLDGEFFWLASDASYNLDVNAGYFATPSSFTIPGYITDFELLDLIVEADTIAICDGDSTTLTSRFNADGFAWYLNGSLLPATHQSIIISQTGTYQLLAHSDNGYDMWSEQVVVVSGTSPTAGFSQSVDTAYVGSVVLFTDSSSGGMTYTWTFGDGGIGSSFASPIYSYSAPGTYTVMQVVSNGLCSDTAYSQVVVLPIVGVESPGPEDHLVLRPCRPNPTQSGVEIAFTLNRPDFAKLEIVDATGRSIHTLQKGEFPTGTTRIHWDLETNNGNPVPSGVYMVILTGKDQRASQRLVIQR